MLWKSRPLLSDRLLALAFPGLLAAFHRNNLDQQESAPQHKSSLIAELLSNKLRISMLLAAILTCGTRRTKNSHIGKLFRKKQVIF